MTTEVVRRQYMQYLPAVAAQLRNVQKRLRSVVNVLQASAVDYRIIGLQFSVQRLVHIGDMIRPFIVRVIPGIDTCSAEMLQQQTVAILLVLVVRSHTGQATNFFLVQTQFLPADGCYATERRVLRRETQKLKPVIIDSHYVLPHFPEPSHAPVREHFVYRFFSWI